MVDEELRDGILGLISILNKAYKMEESAVAFYKSAANHTDSESGKKMFNWLAEFEVHHVDKIGLRRKELLDHPTLAGVEPPKLDEEYVASEGGWSRKLGPNPSDIDILKMAITNEMRAFAFYQRKLTHAADENLQLMWNTLAKEEEHHVKILTDLKDRLFNEGLWGDINEIQESMG